MIYQKLSMIISKWPVSPGRACMDYGYHLRSLLKPKELQGNVFLGNQADNLEQLDSLLRIVSNYYKKKYSYNKEVGAAGIEIKHLDVVLDTEFIKQYNDLQSRILNFQVFNKINR